MDASKMSSHSEEGNQFVVLFNRAAGSTRIQYLLVDKSRQSRLIPKLSQMGMPRLKDLTAFQVVTLDNFIYVIGGRNFQTGAILNQCIMFDSRLNQWMWKGSLVRPRCRCTADVIDGKIYVTGGEVRGGRYSDSVECYDPVTDKWTELKAMPQLRADHASCVLQGKLFVCGGAADRKSQGTNTFWQYEPSTDYWIEATEKARLPAGRHKHMMVAHRDVIYCFGGRSLQPGNSSNQLIDRDDGSTIAFDCSELGDLATEIEGYWRRDIQPMQFTRSNAAVAVIGHNIFVLGGHNYKEDRDAKVVEYFNTYKEKWTLCFKIDKGPYLDMAASVLEVPASNKEFNNLGLAMNNRWTLW